MRILWLVNIIMPKAAERLGVKASNKEGWLTGICDTVSKNSVLGFQSNSEMNEKASSENENAAKNNKELETYPEVDITNSAFHKSSDNKELGIDFSVDITDGAFHKSSDNIELGICFPVDIIDDGFHETIDNIEYFGFYEDTVDPHIYHKEVEGRLDKIVRQFKPDIVHMFGTEYPHFLAMTRVMKDSPQKLLVGIQGILKIYTDHFCDGVPDYVINRRTFRDRLKKDSILEQKEKYRLRGINETEGMKLVGNVTGRTPFDKEYSKSENPKAQYYHMNETLRTCFYEGKWEYDKCEPHSIFLSQGNYPIKGFHYVLQALPKLIEKYPDIKVYVAGDRITADSTIKDKIKISSYGKYLLELIDKENLSNNVVTTGSLTAEEMKTKLLECALFVCPSTIENSPNSLGEAMLLGVPCVTSNVGGIPGIFDDGKDGIMYEAGDALALADAVDEIFSAADHGQKFGEAAMAHARRTHDPKANYERLMEIYRTIYQQQLH